MDVEHVARISVIFPVYNEADSLPILWPEHSAVLPALGQPTEVIFVDEGSTDGSADVIRTLVERAVECVSFA